VSQNQQSASPSTAAHGGELKWLIASPARVAELKQESVHLPSWDLTFKQLCDIELLLNGGFSPLDGFLGQADYESVRDHMRLANGVLWPMPIMLDVTEQFGGTIQPGARIALRHPEGMVIAVLTVGDIWKPDFQREAQQVFGTTDDTHPGVFTLFKQTNPVYVGGKIEGLELPIHHSYTNIRFTPHQLRRAFAERGWKKIVAFQTRNPMHRAHVELTQRAAAYVGANLLIHPVVGQTKPGDVDHFLRVRCYQAALKHYDPDTTELSLLQLAMRMGGPREAVWHAIIRKNHGVTHFIVGRDHAGPGNDKNGKPFYGPYEAQEVLAKHAEEIGIEPVTFNEMVYVKELDKYLPRPEVPQGMTVLNISGTELRRMLNDGSEIPAWFSYPEVIDALRATYPPRKAQGFTVFFTGLPSSGKSTIANALVSRLMEEGSRPVTLLDGDLVRKHLSSELTFSKEHRDLNIRRIGYVASEITKNHGVAICAPIAPYAAVRREVREMVSGYGGFIEVYVSTPVEVCEQRDRKGLYAKARAGILKGFTGIDDPYEVPEHAELVIDTSRLEPDEAASAVLDLLAERGYIAKP